MSCSPRPRVSQLRPSQSIFHISTLVPLIGQALIHIIILSKGAEIFSSLPGKSTSFNHKRLSLRFADADGVFLSAGSHTNPIHRFVPRERFRPNLLTNYVFILSIAQNTIIALTNQLGKPYQEDILECRSVILWAFLSLLFCTILVTEEFPLLNQFLELAPWPNTKAKAVMILLLAFDALASIGLRYLTRYPQRHRRSLREDSGSDGARTAADYEVKALARDREENLQLLWVLVGLLTTVIVKGLLS
jgi:magnesium-transporting ATPase (P-type)